jgi:mRNA-degrading endonuclease RelE of RelBE toxin-antitoxin system
MNYKIVNTPEFAKELKRLSSKYPSLKFDFSIFLNDLSKDTLKRTSLGNNYYKIRLAITSKGRDKSGGARVITYV